MLIDTISKTAATRKNTAGSHFSQRREAAGAVRLFVFASVEGIAFAAISRPLSYYWVRATGTDYPATRTA
jgi:hypothetical protein